MTQEMTLGLPQTAEVPDRKHIVDICKTDSSETHFCSSKNCLLNYLDESQRRALPAGLHQSKVLHKGELLTVQGARFWAFYQIRSGSFKSYFNDTHGNWHTTGFHFPGDIVGLDALQSGRYAYQIQALETSSVCGLPFASLNRVLGSCSGSFYRQLIATLSASECRRYETLMLMTRMRADQRLAHFILDISQRMQARGVSTTEFNLSMARYDIANYLGVAVETLSRLFKRLQQEQLISVHRQHLRILDMTALESLALDEPELSLLSKTA